MRDVQVVKLSSHVRPAGCFLNAPCFIDLIEPRVTIRLQRPDELAQVLFRMLTLAIRRVGEPRRWWCCVSRGTIIAHVRPQPPGFRFAVARCEHRNWRVVGMQLACRHHWRRSASTNGASNWLVPPTQSASVERSNSTPSRA